MGADLYEVDYAHEDGDPIRGERRLRAFNLGQRLLVRQDNALLLFDEVEDVFERDPFARWFGGHGDGATAGKAWINRTLENNPVPALWLTNDADSMNRNLHCHHQPHGEPGRGQPAPFPVENPLRPADP